MSLSPQFLDQLRDRTTLSALIGGSLKLEKAGREFKACCPFHGEKTPSFTINDEKGFYHCFGCGAHGDAIRWLIDHRGLGFIDAVKELADKAGLDVPAPTPEVAQRQERAASASDVLGSAARWYAEQLGRSPAIRQWLIDRGVTLAQAEAFGLGLSSFRTSVTACGAPIDALLAVGLLREEQGQAAGLYRDSFRGRLMVPIHDARGRVVGFGARALPNRDGETPEPKYLNSADSETFDKGRLLFNHHRAAPAARMARRLVIVEGYFDVIAMDRAEIAECVAPMGTALTEAQLERAWRIHHRPVLLFDGDAAGRKAAHKACERALPLVGWGRELTVALLPAGQDPDDLEREGGRAAIEAVLDAARPMFEYLWDVELAAADTSTPEGRSALRRRLGLLAGGIQDEETRAQYRVEWDARYAQAFPPPPPGLSEEDMLPIGTVAANLSALGEGERSALIRVSEAWMEREVGRMTGPTPAEVCRFAWSIGRRVGAGLIDFFAGQNALTRVRENCPDAKAEDISAAWDAGDRKGFDLAPMLLDLRCSGFERTDLGNAERFEARFGRDYLYTTAKGWLGWDGRRYQVLNQEKDVTPAEVQAAVFETVRGIQREAAFIRDSGVRRPDILDGLEETASKIDQLQWNLWQQQGRPDHGRDMIVDIKNKGPVLLSDLIGRWGRASEASGRLGCIANLAKRWLTVEITSFDTNPMIFNCRNGTLHFLRADDEGPARVELRPHDRADLLTKMAACDYDPDAPAPEWQKLVRWAQPNKDRRRYLRQWGGYNLTGDMGEQIFHIWWGPTAANGKSTVGNAMREAAGDYGDITNVETFLDEGQKKRGDQATPDIVRLPGVRFLTSGEPAKGAKINEPLINSVTGGDPMLARDNFRSFFRFTPSFKWTLWCNAKPDIPQGTEGIWRRVKVLLWESHLEEHQKDRDLPNRLKKEYPGILAWMVRGLIDWMENGFVEPEDVKLQSEAYRDDSDPLASFLRMCTVEDHAGRVQSSHLYEVFCAWAKAAGEAEWKQKGFTRAMKDRGFTNKQSNGIHWLGLKLVKQKHDFVDDKGEVVTFRDDGPSTDADAGRPPPDDDDNFVPF
ncbi:DNA primase [Sphingobium sp. JS3065]|uniref:DNA primase n=1 Tax=Sphingobium sp. JS3065 TaxID=2970925 RepID=UPI002264E166|nr:DNA primase [Sphingobium sp. JS3065]UZW55541.1 DNA primase [Sphingobium sp. JS3065]